MWYGAEQRASGNESESKQTNHITNSQGIIAQVILQTCNVSTSIIYTLQERKVN